MTKLVVGATGATGRLLVKQLLDRGAPVRALVRSPDKIPPELLQDENFSVVHGAILDLNDDDLLRLVDGCDGIASCLGHTPDLRGVFGSPRRLVADATRRLCRAATQTATGTPTRFVLMNTAGNRNRDLAEEVSWAERGVVSLVRLLVPPHADNEAAADYLRSEMASQNGPIEWAVVRPDSLIDADDVSEYEVHASPTRSAIFNPGKTSRINVAHLMAQLLTDDATWRNWRGRMPVVYNKS